MATRAIEVENGVEAEAGRELAFRIVSISALACWADAIIAMDVDGPLPSRVVLVPSEAHAHALRRELVVRAPRALAGTRFLTPVAAARAVLAAAEVDVALGEEARRPLRVRALLRDGTAGVEHAGTHGWAEAIASTIEQLEAAGLQPHDLDGDGVGVGDGDARARELAALWRASDDAAGSSWTSARILVEAARRLAADPGAWPFTGPVLAHVTIGLDAAHVRFLRALPRLTLAVAPGRPARRSALEHARTLWGDAVANALAIVASDSGPPNATELAVVQRWLFEPPDRFADPARSRSRGPDGTVDVELYAGVDEELDAAARWACEQVFDHATPLQHIAILAPTDDALPSLIADRLAALPWPDGTDPVHVAGGRPAAHTAAGARVLAVLDALARYLPADAMLALVPRLRLDPVTLHIGPERARRIVASFGTRGGSVARPADALRWSDRLTRADLDDHARAIAPAVAALVDAAAGVLAGATVEALWTRVRAFVTDHVRTTAGTRELLDELDGEVARLAGDPVGASVVGVEAIELLVKLVRVLRLRAHRYGEPAIYVGTITSAAGLSFAAVRIVGLAESRFPGTLRQDALLPADLRRRLGLPGDDGYAARRLHALDRVIRGTTQRLVLSAARTDLDGSEREPAALFVEAAAALGRPSHEDGAPGPVIPTLATIERDGFAIARAARARRLERAPLSAACWLWSASRHAVVPSTWATVSICEPDAVRARVRAWSGVLGAGPLREGAFVPGPRAPLSAAALRLLLHCPQRFLFERVLGLRPRSVVADGQRIAPDAYGALVHRVVEVFARAHGPAFGAREGELAAWLAFAEAIADAELASLLERAPLTSTEAAATEHRRLRRDVRQFLEDDWAAGVPRRFVAAEREFGSEAPVALPTATGPVYVTGRIDRIDVEGGLTLVRDLKTGRARPRDRDDPEPRLDVDLQLAIYAAVTRALAAEWSIPSDVAAAYVYVDRLAPERERAFHGDREALERAGRRWFDVAAAILRDHAYARTPDPRDCRWCPFAPVCGLDEPSAPRDDANGTLRAYRELKA